MTQLRISPTTSAAYDALKADMDRIGRALACGATTTEALQQAQGRLADIAVQARRLQVAVRQEIATAQRRERDDRARKAG